MSVVQNTVLLNKDEVRNMVKNPNTLYSCFSAILDETQRPLLSMLLLAENANLEAF